MRAVDEGDGGTGVVRASERQGGGGKEVVDGGLGFLNGDGQGRPLSQFNLLAGDWRSPWTFLRGDGPGLADLN